MVFLHSNGVGTARAVLIFKTYGADAVQVMTENPYRLARDIRGIGFKSADAIAMKLGIEKTAMIRLCAGISYALTEAMDEGHGGLARRTVPAGWGHSWGWSSSLLIKRHLKALAGLFGQVLKLCEQAGFVKLGHVALDGTKIKANASKHKAMSYERMEKRAAELEAEVERWLSAAAAADAEEDRAFGRDKSGAELPKWVADKKKRAEKIRAAKAELEAEAKAAAAAKAKAQAEAEERRQAEGRKKPGKPAAPPSEEPDPKAQKNFTDPESRIMKTKDGFIQGYNAQAAVDATAQVIVAHGLDAKQSDQHQLAPIADAIEANLGKKPTQLSADAGYCSDANLAAMEEREIDAYIAPGRAKHAGKEKAAAPASPPCAKESRPAGTPAPTA